jgi:hypothetical protein
MNSEQAVNFINPFSQNQTCSYIIQNKTKYFTEGSFLNAFLIRV